MAKKPRRKIDKEEQELDEAELGQEPSMEELMAALSQLLEEQEFESLEEASAFLDEVVVPGQALPTARAKTDLDKAQNVIYDALEAPTRRQRVRLARKALRISPDCADAYVLLAQESAETVEEAKELYQQGLQAGERAIGEEALKELEGHFWGFLETRPYMRARQGLAMSLWEMGQREEAMAHYQEMLRLNPNDNQGIRYVLLNCLLDEGRDKDAAQLLKRYRGDVSANWLYTTALPAFRKSGANRRANKLLADALDYNPHVPDYLLGRRRLPKELPDYIQMRGETEAADYVSEAGHFWLQQPGAIDWLRERAGQRS